MNSLSVRKIITLSTAITLFLLFGLSIVAWTGFSAAIDGIRVEHDRSKPSDAAMRETRFSVVQIQQFLTDVSATGEEGGYEDARKAYDEALKSLGVIAKLQPDLATETSRIEEQIRTFHAVGEVMAEAYVKKDREAGNIIMKKPDEGFDARAEQLTKALTVLETRLKERVDASAMETEDRLIGARRSSAFLGLAVVLLVIASGFTLFRVLLRLLGGEPAYVADAVGRIAQGDLSAEMAIQPGDHRSLLYSLKSMQANLRAIVGEIKSVVEAAAVRGDFSVKMNLSGKAGYTLELSELLNQLSNVSETGLNDVTRVAIALANGDLSQKITKDYPGVFGQTKAGVNNTVDSLTKVVGEIRKIVDGAANRGDFSIKLDMVGKAGYAKELSELLNKLSLVTETGLNDVARVLKSVAKGDLTETVDANYSGIFGQLKDDTNATVDRLREVIGRIVEATEAINTAASEIAAGNQDLSSRTEEQASSLEETSSSMEELNSTVRNNAENANKANQLAKTANTGILRGGEAVKQVVITMSDIQTSSKKIADIIGVIDSIAFQTNILALNAAVEAARAGEQGRGFAVVATEVRHLAQRSATAAKEIKDLIAASVEKVEDGANQVGAAGKTIEDVVTSFAQVATLVTGIAGASREQSAGIEQVTQAVGQMDEITQQNAALVEQAAAAAESLEEQAHSLLEAVSMFKLAGGDRRGLPTVVHTPARAGVKKSAVGQLALPAKPTQKETVLPEDGDEWAEF